MHYCSFSKLERTIPEIIQSSNNNYYIIPQGHITSGLTQPPRDGYCQNVSVFHFLMTVLSSLGCMMNMLNMSSGAEERVRSCAYAERYFSSSPVTWCSKLDLWTETINTFEDQDWKCSYIAIIFLKIFIWHCVPPVTDCSLQYCLCLETEIWGRHKGKAVTYSPSLLSNCRQVWPVTLR